MAEAIVITAALRGEITADLAAGGERAKRWRPDVAQGDDVLALAFPPGDPDLDDDPRWGQTGGVYSVRHEYRDASWEDEPEYGLIAVTVSTPDEKHHPRASDLNAWAPVGGVDGGPRPDIGDRVLVLDAPGVSAATGLVATVEDQVRALDGRFRQIECRFDPYIPNDAGSHHGLWDVTRWAILPPATCWVCSEPDHGNCPECDEAACQGHDAECSGGRAWATYADDGTRQVPDPTGPLIDFEEIANPDQPVDPLTANPDHAWPCADYCCTRGCPGIGNTLHGPPWPCDATRCTCGGGDIRAVAHDRQRLAALVPGLETANHGLHNRNRALRDERDRARRIAVALEQELAQLRSRILDRLRDQGLNIDYLAEPDTREQT